MRYALSDINALCLSSSSHFHSAWRAIYEQGCEHLRGRCFGRCNLRGRLALRNLLENAERHSPLDRKVVMAVQADDPPGRVTLSVVNWPVDVFVADNRLFERGVRGALPVGDGEGLGLHIVKDVASLHDAEISARVRPDRRTEFVISLPLPGDFSVSKAAR